MLAVVPWLLVPRRATAATGPVAAVRLRLLVRSSLAWQLAVFFGLQAMQAYVIVGWTAQYLRDEGMSAAAAGVLVGVNALIVIPLNALVPSGAVRQSWQRPMLLGFMACYLVGWTGLLLSPLTLTWLWMSLLGVGMGTFAMVLSLLGLRARTPETVNALSTVVQGWGYAIAAAGPVLVGLLRGLTGGYTGMFVLVYAGVAGLFVTGWLVCADRQVDDEVPGLTAAAQGDDTAIETAGAESPVVVDTTRA